MLRARVTLGLVLIAAFALLTARAEAAPCVDGTISAGEFERLFHTSTDTPLTRVDTKFPLGEQIEIQIKSAYAGVLYSVFARPTESSFAPFRLPIETVSIDSDLMQTSIVFLMQPPQDHLLGRNSNQFLFAITGCGARPDASAADRAMTSSQNDPLGEPATEILAFATFAGELSDQRLARKHTMGLLYLLFSSVYLLLWLRVTEFARNNFGTITLGRIQLYIGMGAVLLGGASAMYLTGNVNNIWRAATYLLLVLVIVAVLDAWIEHRGALSWENQDWLRHDLKAFDFKPLTLSRQLKKAIPISQIPALAAFIGFIVLYIDNLVLRRESIVNIAWAFPVLIAVQMLYLFQRFRESVRLRDFNDRATNLRLDYEQGFAIYPDRAQRFVRDFSHVFPDGPSLPSLEGRPALSTARQGRPRTEYQAKTHQGTLALPKLVWQAVKRGLEALNRLFLRAAAQVLFLFLPILLIFLGFVLAPDGYKIRWFWDRVPLDLMPETRLILYIFVWAALGGVIAVLYNAFRRRGSALLSLMRGAWETTASGLVGCLFYVLLRAGVFAPSATADSINPLGIAALSFGIGLATPTILQRIYGLVVGIYGNDSDVIRVVEHLDDRLDQLLGAPTLDNFEGSVEVYFEGADRVKSAEGFVVLGGAAFDLSISIVSEISNDKGQRKVDWEEQAISEPVRIRDGAASELVVFDVAVDSEHLDRGPQRQTTGEFRNDQRSPTLFFRLKVPEMSGESEAFVEVYQKNRLIQVVRIPFYIRGVSI